MQDAKDQRQLKYGGHDVEDHGVQDGGNAPGSAINGLGQGSSLSIEMEWQVQVV